MDYRGTQSARRQSWHGTKRYAKRVLSWRVPHFLLRTAVERGAFATTKGRLPAPASLREVNGRVGSAEFVMLRPDRCEIAKELYWGGGKRPRPEDDLALNLFATLARDADLALDIGAYTGVFTLVAARINESIEVQAFEIVPAVYKALFDNCVRNGILHQVTLHHTGLGKPGTFATVPVGTGGSALPSFYSAGMTFTSGVKVRIDALDDLGGCVRSSGGVVMKIDVEGGELDVVTHGQRFLRERRPHILCEVLAESGSDTQLTQVLDPLEYNYYLVRERDLVHYNSIEASPRFRDWLITHLMPSELRDLEVPVARS